MNWLKRIFRSMTGYSDMDDFWYGPILQQTAAGVDVNEYTSLNYSAVFNAITLISGTVGSLPLVLYIRKGKGKERAVNHPLYGMVHDAFNPEITAMSARECLAGHLLSWGNCYINIVRNNRNIITELWPITPNRVTPCRENGRIYYEVTVQGEKITLERDRMFHIPGMGFNGLVGYSVITMARESIALGMATEKFGANFFGKGTHPGVIVSHPGKLSEPAHTRLSHDLTSKYSGLGRSHRLLLLEEGMKLEKLGYSPEDSQFLGTREFQIPEIARWFNLPPHKLKDLSRSTFSNIEHQSIEYVTDSILPWLVRIEQNMNLSLLTEAERRAGYFFEHNIDGLLRSDSASRADFYNKMWNMGAFSINEIRAKENLNPIEGGDTHFVPMNMIPIEYALRPEPDPEPSSPEPDPVISEAEEKSLRSWINPEYRDNIAQKDRVKKRYTRLFRDTAQRIVNKEVLASKKQIKQQQRNRAKSDFIAWLDQFYEDHQQYIVSQFSPLFSAYADSIREIAQEEVGIEDIADFESFLEEYTETYAQRHVGSSKGQIISLISEEDDYTDIENRLDEWSEKRPDKIAENESTRLMNAASALVYWSAGMWAVWQTKGKSCPYCQMLNGKKIKQNGFFAGDGDEVRPEGKEPMKINGIKKHPPLHRGCDCYLRPGR